MTSHVNKINSYPSLISIILLLLSFFDFPYGYYTLMKIIVTGSAIYYAHFINSELKKNDFWFWCFVFIVILFNPIIPIHLGNKSSWAIIDIVVISYFLIFTVKGFIAKLLNKTLRHILIKRKYFISFLVILIILLSLSFLIIRENNSCLTVYTMNDDFDINNINRRHSIFIDDDFYLNSCETDSYDCDDFCSQKDAQKIFDECYNFGGAGVKYVRDINSLDGDKNGVACEALQ